MRYYYSHDMLYDGDPDPKNTCPLKRPSWVKRLLAWIAKGTELNPPKCGC